MSSRHHRDDINAQILGSVVEGNYPPRASPSGSQAGLTNSGILGVPTTTFSFTGGVLTGIVANPSTPYNQTQQEQTNQDLHLYRPNSHILSATSQNPGEVQDSVPYLTSIFWNPDMFRTTPIAQSYQGFSPFWGPSTSAYWPVAVQHVGGVGQPPLVPTSPYSDVSMASTRPSGIPTPIFEEDIEQDIHEQLGQVPGDYVCHICNGDTPDGGRHRIQVCPKRNLNPPTPYQGSRESAGKFECPCGHSFISQYVYSNAMKQCHRCRRFLSPVRMYKKHQQQVPHLPQFNGFI